MQTYSFKTGFFKGLLSLLAILGALAAFAGFNDVSVWDLLSKYLQPVIGSLTVGGAITIAVNYFKFKLNNPAQPE